MKRGSMKIGYCTGKIVIPGLFLISGFFFGTEVNAQRLNLFTSESGKIMNGSKIQEVPYSKTTSYFDFIDSTEVPMETIEGHSYYYLYLVIPIEVEEIGLRMISPVPDYYFPNTGDIETDSFTVHTTNRKDFFDPWISLERADSNFTEGNFNLPFKFNRWKNLGYNDDSNETIAQPSGKYTNSVLRVTNKKFSAGIYRIRFTTSKDKRPEGTYLVQVGLIPGVKGIKMGRTVAELNK